MNTTIKKKIGHCVDCPPDAPDKILIDGRCVNYHYPLHRMEVNKKKNEARNLPVETKTKTQTTPADLIFFYSRCMATNIPICENCLKEAFWIKESDYKKLWKSAQAHILPKGLFPSVRSHPMNCMVLFAGYSGVCNCHDLFDSSWDNAASMRVFATAKQRFQLFEKDIAPNERRRIPIQLLT